MTYDLTDPGFLTHPDPVLAQMRAEGPVVQARLPIVGKLWVTTTDEAARIVLKTPDLFVRNRGQSGGKPLERQFWWMPRFMKPLVLNMLGYDGPPHQRLRKLVDHAFARTEIAALEDDLTTIADTLLDRIEAAEVVDIRATYAQQFPLMVICQLLGIPDADRARIMRQIAPISAVTNPFRFMIALFGLRALMQHFRRDIALVRNTPRPGLISELVHAEVDGERLTDDELVAMIVTLFVAGHETTVHLITNGIDAMLRDPTLQDHWRTQPEGRALMVEEMMRYASPVMMTNIHFVREDTDILGVPLPQDARVAPLLLAANHDPARHATPEQFDPVRRPNAHLGFGHGAHVCLGMQLARAEARIGISRLLDRFPQIALATPDAPPNWSRRPGLRGPERLLVRLNRPPSGSPQ